MQFYVDALPTLQLGGNLETSPFSKKLCTPAIDQVNRQPWAGESNRKLYVHLGFDSQLRFAVFHLFS